MLLCCQIHEPDSSVSPKIQAECLGLLFEKRTTEEPECCVTSARRELQLSFLFSFLVLFSVFSLDGQTRVLTRMLTTFDLNCEENAVRRRWKLFCAS